MTRGCIFALICGVVLYALAFGIGMYGSGKVAGGAAAVISLLVVSVVAFAVMVFTSKGAI